MGQVYPINTRERIQILKIAYREATKLLGCPTMGRCHDKEFWVSLLEIIKAEVRRDLPRRWSTWSGVKESLNWNTCRQGHKAEARAAPRKGASAELREQEYWIDQWVRIWTLRKIQVYGSEVFDALQEHFGKQEVDHLLGDGLGDVNSNDFEFLSICRPDISEAVRNSRNQIGGKLLDSDRSCLEDLDESLEQLHSPDASASRDSRGPDTHISRETSLQDEAWRRRSQASPILGSTPAAECMRLRKSIEHTHTPSPATREQTSDSTASSASSEFPSLSNFPIWTPAPKPKLVPLSSPEPAANKSESKGKSKGKGKDIAKSNKTDDNRAGHGSSSAGVSNAKPSSRSRIAPSAVTSGKPTNAKSFPAVRENRAQSAHSGVHASRRRLSRTPAAIAEENARVARKHQKPLAPVRIPSRVVPDAEFIPAQNGLKCDEIPGSAFYGQPQDRTPQTPPRKRQFRRFDTATSAGGSPGHRVVDKQGVDWYNQDTTLPRPSVETSSGQIGTRQKEKPASLARSCQDEEEDPFAPSPIKPTTKNIPPKPATDPKAQPSSAPNTSTPKKSKKRKGDSQTPEKSPAPSRSAPADTTSPSPSKKSKKRKRSNEPEDQVPLAVHKSPSVDPFAESPSPSVTRSKKRRRHGSGRDSAALSESPTATTPTRSTQCSKPATGSSSSVGQRAGGTSSPRSKGEWQNKKGEHRGDRKGVTSTARSGSGNNWQGSQTPRKHWPGSQGRQSTTRSPSGPKHRAPAFKGGSGPKHIQSTPPPAETASPASSGLFVDSEPRSGASRHGSRHRGSDYAQAGHASEEPGWRQARESTVATAIYDGLPREEKEKVIFSAISRSKRQLARLESQIGQLVKVKEDESWLSEY